MKHMRDVAVPVLCLLGGILLCEACPGLQAEAGTPDVLEPLKVELPKPYFGGTPWDGMVPFHTELDNYKPRPPCLVPKGVVVVSRGKPVTSSQPKPLFGELKQITDGDKGVEKESVVELGAGLQWIQIDLGAAYDIYAFMVWHNYERKRIYYDVIIRASNDPDFKDAQIVYNNDWDNSARLGIGKDEGYFEGYEGRLMAIPNTVQGRYVRLYSDGNTDSESNFYTEAEVFGKPAAK